MREQVLTNAKLSELNSIESSNINIFGLNKKDSKTLFLASLGGMLECYDFMIFAFFASTLAIVFFPASDPFWATINAYGTPLPPDISQDRLAGL